MNRSCNAPASAESLKFRVGHSARVALLLMGLSLMCILMVNVPGSRAMAAAPDGSESQQESSVERIAARSTQEPGDTTVKPRRRSAGVQVASLGHERSEGRRHGNRAPSFVFCWETSKEPRNPQAPNRRQVTVARVPRGTRG